MFLLLFEIGEWPFESIRFLAETNELFAHFMTTGDLGAKGGKTPTSPLKMKAGRPKMKKDEKSKLIEAGEWVLQF